MVVWDFGFGVWGLGFRVWGLPPGHTLLLPGHTSLPPIHTLLLPGHTPMGAGGGLGVVPSLATSWSRKAHPSGCSRRGRDSAPETRNPKPETRYPKIKLETQTPNPKPETRNPEGESRKANGKVWGGGLHDQLVAQGREDQTIIEVCPGSSKACPGNSRMCLASIEVCPASSRGGHLLGDQLVFQGPPFPLQPPHLGRPLASEREGGGEGGGAGGGRERDSER